MGPKERRAREREEIRTVILDAAREMFATEGFDAVTMRRIAEKIEYSPIRGLAPIAVGLLTLVRGDRDEDSAAGRRSLGVLAVAGLTVAGRIHAALASWASHKLRVIKRRLRMPAARRDRQPGSAQR